MPAWHGLGFPNFTRIDECDIYNCGDCVTFSHKLFAASNGFTICMS